VDVEEVFERRWSERRLLPPPSPSQGVIGSDTVTLWPIILGFPAASLTIKKPGETPASNQR